MRNMSLQVLVSTMNQIDYSLISQMNINTEAIIINQCDTFSYHEWFHKNRKIEWYCFPEQGIGLSRNNALMRASGDILLFADDDVVYTDDYSQKIKEEFERCPQADIILFNVESTDPQRIEYQNRRFHKLHIFNSLRYGTVRMAVKREQLLKKNIAFSLLFGGGTTYGSGEDTLFLVESLKKGLKLYASPVLIGKTNQRGSTWFSGYHEKYFHDKGALFAGISSGFAELLCIQFCIRHRDILCGISVKTAYRYMLEGIKEFRKTVV